MLLIKCCYYYPEVRANLVPLLKYYPQLFIMNYEHVINGLKRGFCNFPAHAVLQVQQIWASSYYTNTENRFSIVNQKVSIITVAVLYFNLCFSSPYIQDLVGEFCSLYGLPSQYITCHAYPM